MNSGTFAAVNERERPHVAVTRSGLLVGQRTVPLLAAAIHYFRLDPKDWPACVQAAKDAGLTAVDTYVPWSVHERRPGELDLGEHKEALDLDRFLTIVRDAGLLAIVRPGPHINAELTGFGVPERVLWDSRCQAKSASGAPVVLPMIPFAFPVPSYASAAFDDEVRRFFEGLAPVLRKHRYPDGPIVLLQVDNEGAFYFRDGLFDQDYHPDALAAFSQFLAARYESVQALGEHYGVELDEGTTFADIEPPKAFVLERSDDPHAVRRALDWAAFHEYLLASAMVRYRDFLVEPGLSTIPTMHNFPPGQEATPLNAGLLKDELDLIGLDYYHRASTDSRLTIARRTTELALRGAMWDQVPFACELGAGFPPFFAPLTASDNAFAALTAMAYGLRGFNLYMFVERDRWIGSPVDVDGTPQEGLEFWTKLTAAIHRTRFHELSRRPTVALILPRVERRLARVYHAFGAVTPAAIAMMGGTVAERCAEPPEIHLAQAIIGADRFLNELEAALERRGLGWAHLGDEVITDPEEDVERLKAAGVRCLAIATSGVLGPRTLAFAEAAAARGLSVAFGPTAPTRSDRLTDLTEEQQRRLAELTMPRERDPVVQAAVLAERWVSHADQLMETGEDGVEATLHVDVDGTPRVLFVINATGESREATLRLKNLTGLRDSLTEERIAPREGELDIPLPARTVRMFEID